VLLNSAPRSRRTLDFIRFLAVDCSWEAKGGSFVEGTVDHRCALLRPLLLGHRLIGDQIFSEHVLELLRSHASAQGPCSSAEDAGSNIGRHVFDVMHDDRLFGAGRHEDLDGFVVIAIGSLVERARRASEEIGLHCKFYSEQVRCRVRDSVSSNQSLVIGRVNVYVVQIELRPKQVGLAARLASD
jgi:hypothetical protein